MTPHHPRRAILALCATAALAAPGVAAAAPANDYYAMPVASGAVAVGDYGVAGTDPSKQVTFGLHVNATATWTGDLQTMVGWNTSDVRQGAWFGVSRFSTKQSGKLHVTWKVLGWRKRLFVTENFTKTLSRDASCAPQLAGGAYDCTATSPALSLLRPVGVPNGTYSRMQFRAKFKITPEGADVARILAMDGAPAVDFEPSLSLTPDYQKENNLGVPCGPAGNALSYRLGPVDWTPAVQVTNQAIIQSGLMDPVVGTIELSPSVNKPFGDAHTTSPAFDLKGDGHTTNLGPVAANTIAPVISSITPTTGVAGVPVHFFVDAVARCPITSYEWKFSDGVTLSGQSPARTFAKAGVFGLELTVKDMGGMSAKRSFSVTISK